MPTWLIFSTRQLIDQNKVLQKQQEKAEKNMDIIQDAIAIDQDIEYNQQAMQDLIGQQTSKMQEGLDDEFDKLGEDEMMEELGKYDVATNDTQKEKVGTNKTTSKESSYDAMMKDLLA